MTRVLSFAFRDKFAGERIPTLEEAVEECIKLQLTIYFDVKGHPDEVHTHPNTYVRAPQTDRQSKCAIILFHIKYQYSCISSHTS